MKIMLAFVFGYVLCGASARAGSVTSHEGGLATPESIFTTTLTLPTTEDVTLQTFGFGGGVNGHHLTIPTGGFDPLLAIFSGTGMGAAIVTDGTGNPFGTSDLLSNYPSFMGCPTAGTRVDFVVDPADGSPVITDNESFAINAGAIGPVTLIGYMVNCSVAVCQPVQR